MGVIYLHREKRKDRGEKLKKEEGLLEMEERCEPKAERIQ